MPPPRPAELASLRKSLSSQGVLDAIVVSAGPACPGEIADGQARALLATELGIDCPTQERHFPTEAEFHAYRLTSNLERRQLSLPDLIRIGLRLEPHQRAQAAQRKTQAAGKRQGEKAQPVAPPEESGEARAQVARAVGLKPNTYSHNAAILKEGRPELIAALDAGQEAVNRADSLALEVSGGQLVLSETALLALAAAAARLLTPAATAELSPYLTVAQAAAYLQTSRQRIYDLLSARRIPKYKDGARVLLLRNDLDRYLHQEAR